MGIVATLSAMPLLQQLRFTAQELRAAVGGVGRVKLSPEGQTDG